MSKIIYLLLMAFFCAENIFAQKLEKIGGVYTVQKILAVKTGEFRIVFKAKDKSQKQITAVELLTDHIHPGITEGLEIKISAEIDAVKNHTAHASQVLVFVPSKNGANPVWLVAHGKNFQAQDSDFLKLHAPSNDYLIL